MATTFKKEDGDFVFTAVGRPQTIFGNELLAQHVGDTLLTDYDPSRGTGCEVRKLSKVMAQPQVIPTMGDAFLARVVEDSMQRLTAIFSGNPGYSSTERIVGGKTTVGIQHPTKKSFLLFATVVPERGDPIQTGYRVRLRQQYPGQDARTIFPAGIVTDDSVP